MVESITLALINGLFYILFCSFLQLQLLYTPHMHSISWSDQVLQFLWSVFLNTVNFKYICFVTFGRVWNIEFLIQPNQSSKSNNIPNPFNSQCGMGEVMLGEVLEMREILVFFESKFMNNCKGQRSMPLKKHICIDVFNGFFSIKEPCRNCWLLEAIERQHLSHTHSILSTPCALVSPQHRVLVSWTETKSD